jgi:hypothetical protein
MYAQRTMTVLDQPNFYSLGRARKNHAPQAGAHAGAPARGSYTTSTRPGQRRRVVEAGHEQAPELWKILRRWFVASSRAVTSKLGSGPINRIPESAEA